MSNQFFCRPTQQFLTICIIILMGLAACTPPTQISQKNEQFIIENQVVILKKSHILAIQTQLYQPSFEIAGIILPKNYANIVAPAGGMLTHRFVETGQLVKKDEKLAVLLPNQPFGTKNEAKPNPITIIAPFTGRIFESNHKVRASVGKGVSLFTLINDDEYKFSGIVPYQLKNNFQIGQTIQFTLNQAPAQEHSPNSLQLGGQITSLDALPPTPSNQHVPKIQVSASITASLKNLNHEHGEPAIGSVVHNELQLGVLVPSKAIIGSVKSLEDPPYKSALPLTAHIWSIRQDGTLQKSEISVIEYRPETKRYLVSGIRDDGLIVVANLPDSANGKLVKIE